MIKLKDILLDEQFSMPTSGASMYPSYQAVRSYEKPVTKAIKATTDWIYDHRHTLLDIAAFGSAFIFPPAAVAIELANAALYFKEDDKLMGTISGVFAALPLIGAIPGVKQAVGFALKRGVKYSLRQIKKILEVIVKFKNNIRRQMLAIESMMKKFPHLNLDKYLEDLIAGKIDATSFYKNFKGYNNKMKVIKTNKAMPLQHVSPDPNLTINKLNLTGFLDNIKNLSRPGSFKRRVGTDALNKPGGFYTTNPQSGFYGSGMAAADIDASTSRLDSYGNESDARLIRNSYVRAAGDSAGDLALSDITEAIDRVATRGYNATHLFISPAHYKSLLDLADFQATIGAAQVGHVVEETQPFSTTVGSGLVGSLYGLNVLVNSYIPQTRFGIFDMSVKPAHYVERRALTVEEANPGFGIVGSYMSMRYGLKITRPDTGIICINGASG